MRPAILVILLLLSLSGCAVGEASPTPTPPATSTQVPPTQRPLEPDSSGLLGIRSVEERAYLDGWVIFFKHSIRILEAFRKLEVVLDQAIRKPPDVIVDYYDWLKQPAAETKE